MEQEIFYPNDLKKEDIANLEEWQLKVATLHFGKGRKDCVDIGYGYVYRYENISDSRPDYYVAEEKQIIIVCSNDNTWKHGISLRNEIDWNSDTDLLAEIGVSVKTLMENHILTNIEQTQ